ncbi:multiple epidermal growth factor-like domains protein 6 [Mya arenaria]|uniref:multiple epidermal growth factor-like domains protein 6 n=1 Tax=Mya arenaria TaxID=6604 RepID=UPI0022E10ABF|nr:multiple epidermal growth factor-like domains protein 6 [Mya arenaria]
MEVTKILGIIFLHVSQSFSQDCSLCNCCKQGTGCSNNYQLGIDNYCWGGCKDGYMSPQCQKPCVNERCTTCSTNTTCDSCNDGYYGDQCQSQCPSTCTTCTSSTVCTSCNDGYHSGSRSLCLYMCKKECLTCTNTTSCTACKVKTGIGYYGSDCSMICSNKCKYFLCDINGNCLKCADPDFTGGNCDRCVEGKFGRVCNNDCSSCKDNHCPEDRLNALKCDECADGMYGNLCNETCPQHCLNNVCDQENGACECDDDYHFENGKCIPTYCPVNCSTCTSLENCTSCTDNYHSGETCEYECTHCKSGTACRQIDGYCWSACADGHTATLCDIPCFEGCAACHRSRPDECTSCNAGRFGNDIIYNNVTMTYVTLYKCIYKCDPRCFNMSCYQDSGYCDKGCVNGYRDKECSLPCPGNCLNDTCEQLGGKCVHGCAEGYLGVFCLNRCLDYDSQCLLCTFHKDKYDTCTLCKNGTYPGPKGACEACEPNCYGGCDSSTGICHACLNGYMGPFCNVTCPSNCKSCQQHSGICNVCINDFWGDICLNICSVNCLPRNNTTSRCAKTSGKCIHGCLPEKHGLQCERQCDQQCRPSDDEMIECRQEDGRCNKGCNTGYGQTDDGCKNVMSDQIDNKKAGGYSVVTVGIMGGVIALLVIAFAILVGIVVFMKRKQNVNEVNESHVAANKSDEEDGNYEQLQERADQPNYQNVNDNKYDMLFAKSSL